MIIVDHILNFRKLQEGKLFLIRNQIYFSTLSVFDESFFNYFLKFLANYYANVSVKEFSCWNCFDLININ
jgi:hypothetical protein